MLKEYYHISKNILANGTKLEVRYGNIIQNRRYFSFNDHNHDQYLREMIFEEIRTKYFKDKPSRLNSVYLFDNAIDAFKYINDINDKRILYKVTVKENSNLLKASMDLVNMSVRKSIEEIRELAFKYYSGENNNINHEILCDGLAFVKEQIHSNV